MGNLSVQFQNTELLRLLLPFSVSHYPTDCSGHQPIIIISNSLWKELGQITSICYLPWFWMTVGRPRTGDWYFQLTTEMRKKRAKFTLTISSQIKLMVFHFNLIVSQFKVIFSKWYSCSTHIVQRTFYLQAFLPNSIPRIEARKCHRILSLRLMGILPTWYGVAVCAGLV